MKCNVADWLDKDHGVVCRDGKVLVNRFNFYTRCGGYSATVGRRCTGACEEARADFDDYSSAELRCKRLSALRILRYLTIHDCSTSAACTSSQSL